jgi:hypothetical protein
MSDDLSGWLALRETADAAARSHRLTTLVINKLGGLRPFRGLDIGTGTGANIRYLAQKFDGPQQWLAVDKDPRLLSEAAFRGMSLAPRVRVDTRTVDLATQPSPIFTGRHLVTASALLDLVSESWLDWVATECRRTGACVLFVLTYNGRNECDPADPDDGRVFALFNQHQLRDKGLGGPAAGPRATDVARGCFVRAGFEVHVEPSNWHLDPKEQALQRALVEGWASAAIETAPSEVAWIDAWRQRRLAHVDAGRSVMVIGHSDFAAFRAALR